MTLHFVSDASSHYKGFKLFYNFTTTIMRKLFYRLHYKEPVNVHARVQNGLSDWVQLWQLFLVDKGREDQNITISRPSLAC